MLENTADRTAAPPSADPFAAWPEALRRDLEQNRFNGCVGTQLVSETDRVRVWHLVLPPGARCAFHRHVLNYFWTVHTDGRARGYFEDGRVTETEHFRGQTKHLDFAAGEHMLHSVENVGDTDLVFTTVEYLDGPNPPLPVPDEVRLPATH